MMAMHFLMRLINIDAICAAFKANESNLINVKCTNITVLAER